MMLQEVGAACYIWYWCWCCCCIRNKDGDFNRSGNSMKKYVKYFATAKKADSVPKRFHQQKKASTQKHNLHSKPRNIQWQRHKKNYEKSVLIMQTERKKRLFLYREYTCIMCAYSCKCCHKSHKWHKLCLYSFCCCCCRCYHSPLCVCLTVEIQRVK